MVYKPNNKTKKYWEHVFDVKKFDEVSWYQENPRTSLKLIEETGLDKDANIIDVGAGDSNLVDKLLELGFKNLNILDISSKALEKSRRRLGEKAKIMNWIESDILDFKTEDRFDIWHDRALFHFLTSQEDIDKYLESVKKFLKSSGFLIISTFSLNGPEKCSGLNVKRYSKDSMKKLFRDFEHVKSFEEKHITPFKTNQNFVWSLFRVRNKNEKSNEFGGIVK